MKLMKKRPDYVLTGDPLLDSLRAECLRRNFSMQELESFARARGYFASQSWRGERGYYDYRAIVRGIYAMGGTLTIKWSEQ